MNWTNIIDVDANENNTVGLRSDGTVVATGANMYGQCSVGGWTDVVAISAGMFHTLAMRADGSLVAAGSNGNGQCVVDG